MVRGIHLLHSEYYEDGHGEVPRILPEVLRDASGHFYPHVKRELGGLGRARVAYGLIKNVDKLGEGKATNEAIRNFIKPLGYPGDHAGHIIPKCLNGGCHRDNFFPQHARVNQGLGSLEKKRKRDMRQGNYDLQFIFVFTYPDDQDELGEDDEIEELELHKKYPSRPISILQSVVYMKDGKAMGEATFMVLNPIGDRYAILLEDAIPEEMTFLELFRAPTLTNGDNSASHQHLSEQLKLVPPSKNMKIIGGFCNPLPDRAFFTRCVQLAALTGTTILTYKLATKSPSYRAVAPRTPATALSPAPRAPVTTLPVRPNLASFYKIPINTIPQPVLLRAAF